MQSDELLLRRAQKGDAEAFEELMAAQESRMYAIALRMMGNREDAQDCAQEAMVRIYRAMGSFKGQSSLATWIYRITMNTCLDELRRRKVRKVTSLDTLVDDEIADILNANVGTIKSRISRGRERLREILSKHSELFGRSNVK